MKLDLHVHTKYSIDALIEPAQLVRKARSLGIIPIITDHNTVDAAGEFSKLNFDFVLGEEVHTAENFDVIGLYLTEKINRGLPFEEIVDKIKEQGGLVYLPHPFDTTRSGIGKEMISLAKKVDIIEAFNARTMLNKVNEEAAALAEKYQKPKGAGSDSHFLFEFGSTYVNLKDFDLENPKELLRQLKSKNAKITGKKAPIYARGSAEIVKLLSKLGIIKKS